MNNKPTHSYAEVIEMITAAEKQREEVTTEYEFEMVEAELEELYAERDLITNTYEDELSFLRHAGF